MLSRLAACLDVEPWVLLDALRAPEETPRILVVEDAPLILHGLLRTLREELPQAEIQGFRTGGEALEVPRLNIIYLTCHTEYTSQALESYCSGYILKPLTPEKLRRELANLRFPVRGIVT